MKNHVILIAKCWPSLSRLKVACPFLNFSESGAEQCLILQMASKVVRALGHIIVWCDRPSECVVIMIQNALVVCGQAGL